MHRAGLFIAILVFSLPAFAGPASFEGWLSQFKDKARGAGISDRTIEAAFSDIAPLPRVVELDGKQPEKKKTFAEYKKVTLSADRIAQGRALMRAHAATLARMEEIYGVPPQYIVALWGIETSYGKNTGGFQVIPALATLAWDGRRRDFFEKELVAALKIVDSGHISADGMKGSWAGAMGQNQFMPTSFNNFAVDSDRDGRRDIWGTLEDVFASTSNYLKKNGWREGEKWGRRVRLPPQFPDRLTGREVKMTLTQWDQIGVRAADGSQLPKGDMKASIIAPDGAGEGEAYLVYPNYNVIMAWNRSTYFATSVGLLADALAGG